MMKSLLSPVAYIGHPDQMPPSVGRSVNSRTIDARLFNGVNKIKVHSTQFAGLGYANTNPAGAACWRVIDLHESGRVAAVGPLYSSKAELLADLPRYARDSWNY